MREAREGRVCWPEVETGTFVRFASFAYSYDYAAAEPEPIQPEETEGEGEGEGADKQQTSEEKGKGRDTSPAPEGDNTAFHGPSFGSWSPLPRAPPDRHQLVAQHAFIASLARQFNGQERETATAGAGSVSAASSDDDHQPHDYGTEPVTPSAREARMEMPCFKPHLPYSVHGWLNAWKAAESKLKEDRAQYHLKKRRYEEEIYRHTAWSDVYDDGNVGYGAYVGYGHHTPGATYRYYDDSEDYDIPDDIHAVRRHAVRERLRQLPPPPAPPVLPEPKSWIEESSAKSKFTAMNSFSGLLSQVRNHHGHSMSITKGFERRMNNWQESQLPVFLSHLKLYILADMYGVQDLGDLCLKRLHECLAAWEVTRARVPDLIALTHMVYDHTVENDAARRLMVYFWLCFSEYASSCSNFQELVKEQGDFAASLIAGLSTWIH